MTSYYNENDPKAAAWLQALIDEKFIPYGHVDTRSIIDVAPIDLAGFTQAHFFAGIGGWCEALRLSGWPEDRPVWTGSCPCQPFSAAGGRKGFDDQRHLWPHWFHLIEQCQPAIVVGEQVASKDGLAWFDNVQADLEAAGYASAGADLCAAGIGSPHLRQRLYFVGLADGDGDGCAAGLALRPVRTEHDAEHGGATGVLADPHGGIAGQAGPVQSGGQHGFQPQGAGSGGMADADGASGRQDARGASGNEDPDGGARRHPCQTHSDHRSAGHGEVFGAGPVNGFWAGADWLGCRDDRWRPIEPGTAPVADGVQNRMVLVRGYGNAIVPQVGATFVTAIMDLIDGGLR